VSARTKIPSFKTVACEEVEIEVEIDPDDLIDAGWVYVGEGSTRDPLVRMGLLDAVSSLHRQAHPRQALDPVLCHEEPCRSLTLGQLTDR
jgi:hypothetical protein